MSRLNKLTNNTPSKEDFRREHYLAIPAYLYFLIVIPRVEQMVCKLKRNAFFSDPLYLKYTSKTSRSPVLTFLTPYLWCHSSKTLEQKLKYKRRDTITAFMLTLELNYLTIYETFKLVSKYSPPLSWIFWSVYT